MAAPTKITFDTGETISGVDETTATLATRAAATGQTMTGAGARKDVYGKSDRPLLLVAGTVQFDSSYPTGGEDIAEIWKQFKPTARSAAGVPTAWDLRHIFVMHPLDSAGTGKLASIDLTNKKMLLRTTAAAEVANASDQSGALVHFVAYGT